MFGLPPWGLPPYPSFRFWEFYTICFLSFSSFLMLFAPGSITRSWEILFVKTNVQVSSKYNLFSLFFFIFYVVCPWKYYQVLGNSICQKNVQVTSKYTFAFTVVGRFVDVHYVLLDVTSESTHVHYVLCFRKFIWKLID